MEMELLVNASRDRRPSSSAGLAMPLPEAVLTSVLLSVIVACTVAGNVLVILSVFTYKPLRIAQNFFLVSLAVADLTVAVLVMPLNIVHTLFRRWMFGLPLCETWLTLDVLCCTASILNLCAIATDRYRAIHDPINYARKRTLKRVVLTIFSVWVISGVICLPPLIGWNDWPGDLDDHAASCRLTSQRGYVIYSACGSFFIPLIVMTIVYLKIFLATKRRLHERAKSGATAAAASTSSVSRASRFSAANSACKQQSSSRGAGGGANLSKELPCTNNDNHSSDVSCNGGGGGDDEEEAACRVPCLPREESVSDVQQQQLHKVDSKASDRSPIVHQFVEERQKISLSKERRAARILGIVMGVFVVCWLPFFTMYVVTPFCERCALSPRFENFVTWLGYVNSALNPVIYTIFNVDFRRAIVRLLKCAPSQ